MTRRVARRERQGHAPEGRDEVRRLQTRVARLERALVDVLEASDAVMADLIRTESSVGPAFGSMNHWSDPADELAMREFFAERNLDARARDWLLAPKKPSVLSRLRFGRAQRLRAPILPRLRPSITTTP